MRCGLNNQPLVLNDDSEGTVDTGMAKISLAIRCKVGYFGPLDFYHAKISKSTVLGIKSSSR